MKNTMICTVLVLFFVACGAPDSSYEKTIADFVQTRDGTTHDLNFKVVELRELRTITVADSIRILSEEFEVNRSKDIEYAESILSALRLLSSVDTGSSTAAKIHRQQTVIDSIRHAPFNAPENYIRGNSGDPLAVVVRCTYTIDIPGRTGSVTARETFDFYLSPDGKTCYEKIKSK